MCTYIYVHYGGGGASISRDKQKVHKLFFSPKDTFSGLCKRELF